jgi:hypothetical protein
LELVLSVDYDLLVGLEAGIYERPSFADLRNGNRSNLDRIVGIDDVRVGSFRTLLHHRCRYRQPVIPHIQEQPCIDELARP